MSTIFDNINKTVTRHIPNTTPERARKIDIMSDSALANETLREMAEHKHTIATEAMIEAENKEKEKMLAIENMVLAQMTESEFSTALEKINKDTKNYLITDVLNEIYCKALLLDENFIEAHANELRAVIENYVISQGGFNFVAKTAKDSGSQVLKNIISVCEATAKKVNKRKLKEATDTNDASSIIFDMSDDEKSDFEYDKAEISPDEIADLVKQKVFTVVKDEKQRQEAEDALKTDIENELADDDTVKDETTAKEAVSHILADRANVEEATLFNSMLRNVYYEMIKGTVTESVGDNVSINMDEVMAETIAQYTMMEMLYTIGLENYSYDSLESLTQKLINPKHETKKTSNYDTAMYESYYNTFNKIKNLRNVEENLDRLKKLCEDNKSNSGIVKAVIDSTQEMCGIIEKNPTNKTYSNIFESISTLSD